MKQIVVLGAGYAGLRCALDLEATLKSREGLASVTLVDQNPYHQIVQVLHQTATAAIHSREAIIEIERVLRHRQIRFVQGRAAAIDPLRREVALADGTALPYDSLVLALGATTDYAGVPGAAEHSLALRSYDDALRVRDQVVKRYRAAAASDDPKERRILMTTAIVGGGYTGCQLAGELAAWARPLAQEVGAPPDDARVALLDRSNQLVKQIGEWASRQAEAILDRAGVSVYLNTPIEGVEERKLLVGGGRVLRAATIVWAAGVRAPALIAEAGLSVDGTGRVRVDRYLRAEGQAHIFAIGDCAAIPDGEGTVPATASYAMRQGSHLAETIVAELEGGAPRAYEPLRLGELVSLGPHEAVGNPMGVPMTGMPVLLMKKGIEQWYRSTLD